jgi:hypothetical protein
VCRSSGRGRLTGVAGRELIPTIRCSVWFWRQPWRSLLLWTAVCAIPIGYAVSLFLRPEVQCPSLTCWVASWVLILTAGAWLAVVGLVLYLWYRAGREAPWVVIGAVALAVLGLLVLLNVLRV